MRRSIAMLQLAGFHPLLVCCSTVHACGSEVPVEDYEQHPESFKFATRRIGIDFTSANLRPSRSSRQTEPMLTPLTYKRDISSTRYVDHLRETRR
jgi:hypothetical protein